MKEVMSNKIWRAVIIGTIMLSVPALITLFTSYGSYQQPHKKPSIATLPPEPILVGVDDGTEDIVLNKLDEVEESLEALTYKTKEAAKRVSNLYQSYPLPDKLIRRQAKADLLQAKLDYSKELFKKRKLIKKLRRIRVLKSLRDGRRW